MKNPTVILHTSNPAPARDLLAARHPDLAIHTCDSYDALPAMIAETGAEVVYSVRFAGTPGYPRQALIDAPSVTWVSVGGSGIDHMNPWDPQALNVTNSAGVAADMMAQYALGGMLHFSLGLPAFRAAQERRGWIAAGQVEPIDDKTVLIVGLGKTGEAVAARCKAMGMTTLGVRARPKPTPNVDDVHGIDDLPALWGRADFIVTCVPLLDSTRGIVGADAFAAMKDTAVIVDVSRGGVIDEAALLDALDQGRIRGAALDVFSIEPLPADHALWGYDNVIITPHCSSVYEGWDLKSVEMFSDNLTRYRQGQPLTNIVSPARGY
ncbi:D-2-hydroxyacid dehydrogenase [Aliisedimentitalea scapharcae]|uniref:D-2-hydroxyacid dehydrogenase n=1 Tax=Aliisedimentitalea scapharcae TaxID=1524259 RepID=A0ABZ2XY95_9RHOB